MTEQGQPVTGGQAAPPAPRAQKLAMQGLANAVVRGILRAPLLSRLAGERLVTLYVVGRTSGKRYTVPVAYCKQGKDLLIGTPFGWGRNLRTGEPLTVRLKGRVMQADVRVLRDEAEVVAAYETMARDNKAFANFNKIRVDAGGNPDQGDLHDAWESGARAFLLTPR
jgi:hypothetical protein